MIAPVTTSVARTPSLFRPSPQVPQRRRAGGFDVVVCGAGFAGCVVAERLASQLDWRVLLIDRRPHIGGNAYDHYNDDGLLVHRYGPHIFHTNAQRVADYLSNFTEWRDYEHRVLAQVDGIRVPIPINLTTINRLYGLQLDSAGAQAFFAERAEPQDVIRNSRDVVVSQVGGDLYRKFFEGYTFKQWGVDATRLDRAVTSRVPTRTNDDDRYFTDKFQKMPLHGYTRMFERMVAHPNIKLMLNTDFREIEGAVPYRKVVYSGPIDEYFDFCYGKLPYRSLAFEHETLDCEWHQEVAVVNYPSRDVPFTRITEYKHLTGQRHLRTAITREFPGDEGDPYYPVPTEQSALLYKRYATLADSLQDVHFVGRLGTYRYYNMDQVVAQALTLFERLAEQERMGVEPAVQASA
jgi:UDP-galactopyranose mutase